MDASILEAIEEQIPEITIEVCAKEFDIVIEAIRSKAISATKITIFLVSESGLRTVETNKRIKILVETLENMEKMPPVSLLLTERRNILVGYEEPYIPFFQYFNSPKCKIEDLNIYMIYTKVGRDLLKIGFDGNTSIKRLHLSCDARAWKALEGLKGPIESLKLSTTDDLRCGSSKKELKSLISLLKQNQRTLTTLDVKYSIEDDKDILAAISKMNTLTRFKWINNRKFSGDAIASVIENNPKLEELVLESSCNNTKAKLMLKAITTLCQGQIRILKLNLSDGGGIFIPAFEENKNIVQLKINENPLFYQKAVQTIGTMKYVPSRRTRKIGSNFFIVPES